MVSGIQIQFSQSAVVLRKDRGSSKAISEKTYFPEILSTVKSSDLILLLLFDFRTVLFNEYLAPSN